MSFENTPLRKMDYSFPHYLNERKNSISSHMQGNGLPDYAYSEDYNLRKRLSSNGISRAKNFSWEKAISLFENYIQTSCKNREK